MGFDTIALRHYINILSDIILIYLGFDTIALRNYINILSDIILIYSQTLY